MFQNRFGYTVLTPAFWLLPSQHRPSLSMSALQAPTAPYAALSSSIHQRTPARPESRGKPMRIVHKRFCPDLERVHEQFSYFNRRYLPVRRIGDLRLNLVHQFRQPPHAYRALLAGLQQPRQHLLAVELLPAAILLDDHIGHFVDALVGGEAPLATQAVPPPPDGITLPALA